MPDKPARVIIPAQPGFYLHSLYFGPFGEDDALDDAAESAALQRRVAQLGVLDEDELAENAECAGGSCPRR